MYLFYFYICIHFNKIKTTTRVLNMGKNIKSYATTPSPFSPGKGREALRQKVLNPSFKIWYGLTVHIIRF